MAWDDIKSTLESRPDVPDDKRFTAAEWNAMVADQQARGFDTVTLVTTDHTADPSSIILVDASGGPVTVTLPDPTEAESVTVKKTDSSTNGVTVATPGSETIDDEPDQTFNRQYMSFTFAGDGSDYVVVY